MNSVLPISLICVSSLVRWLVGQFPHSGQGKPPLYGDYEAQRHWMEVTVNLPTKDWYKNTPDNDLLYWGLDYPPLTAYHMFAMGKVAQSLNSTWVELDTSRGIETQEHKLFMRSTVLLVDIILYMSAVLYYFYMTPALRPVTSPTNVYKYNVAIHTTFVLLYPAQILIDHGHFQYNCFFMGLVLWAVIAIVSGRMSAAAFLFTLALCYKQMSLYYSLPFFWYLASLNLRRKPLWKGILAIMLIGLIVISTFAVVFLPYLTSVADITQVINRIFPIDRGVFEDKVANFWYSLSIFYKFRNVYSHHELLRASTLLTLLISLPAGIHLLLRPTIRTFKYSLVSTSLVFYLMSYQVHEKTILVPALPILLLIREHSQTVMWFSTLSTFSLQPLLLKDGQAIPYWVLMVTFTMMSLENFRDHIRMSPKILTVRNLIVSLYLTSLLGCYVLGIGAMLIKPPARYPDIHQAMNSFYSCLHFVGFLLFFYIQQFKTDTRSQLETSRLHLIKKSK